MKMTQDNTTNDHLESDENITQLHPTEDEDFQEQTPKKKLNILGPIMATGAILAVPPLLGHYIRKKDGSINGWFVGLGMAISVSSSVYQNPGLFKLNDPEYITKEKFQSKHKGIEQHLISRQESELEVFQKNNKYLTKHVKASGKDILDSVGHTLTNIATPHPLSKLVNIIQGNKPKVISEFIGNFSYDIIDSSYELNSKKKGIGNCESSNEDGNIKFKNSTKENIKCKIAYSKLK